MKKIDKLLKEYGRSHKNPTNKFIHWICVPSIFVSITGFFWAIPDHDLVQWLGGIDHMFVNWATVALILTTIYYAFLSVPLAFGMAIFSMLCMYIVALLEYNIGLGIGWVSLIVFIIAWVGQFYGHKVEGKKPSFFKDIQFLLIGPAWLMHFIYKKLGIQY